MNNKGLHIYAWTERRNLRLLTIPEDHVELIYIEQRPHADLFPVPSILMEPISSVLSVLKTKTEARACSTLDQLQKLANTADSNDDIIIITSFFLNLNK